MTEAILVSRGISVPKVEIIRIFQEFYLGAKGTKGLIENECWLLEIETLRELRKVYYTGIVTGRPREETLYVLKKFGTELLFDVVVSMEDYPMEKSKPDPYPIELALERLGGYGAIYVGDSVDDIKAAVRAGVRAFGCIPPGVQSPNALRELLTKTGAERVLFDVNEILDVLPLKNNTRASCY